MTAGAAHDGVIFALSNRILGFRRYESFVRPEGHVTSVEEFKECSTL